MYIDKSMSLVKTLRLKSDVRIILKKIYIDEEKLQWWKQEKNPKHTSYIRQDNKHLSTH